MESSSSVMDRVVSETTSENYDNCEVGTNASNDGSFHNLEDDGPTLTSSTDESDDSSHSSESEDFKESEEVNLQQENETSQSQEEEPLYEGSKISKILSFVLIVSFVLKHNLSKAAWADLLRLLTYSLGAALSSFLDLHFEEKIKDLFRDSEFLTILKKGRNR